MSIVVFLTLKIIVNQMINMLGPDLEKVVNCTQAGSSEIYNVLKIALFVTKNEHNFQLSWVAPG